MAEKRSIFEEVSARGAVSAAPRGGMIDGARRGARRSVRNWLVAILVLVTLMILVGGLTRLTDSGLSITEWRPVTGSVPPLSDAAWTAEFGKYQATPEYQLQNTQMTLPEFKRIYWWEWGHRQLGRTVGLVWAVGFVWFSLGRRMPAGWTGRLLALGALGGAQGAVGWWMVASGLGGRMVDVASYRLAVHLGLAFVILGLTTWYILSLSRPETALLQARRLRDARLFGLSGGLLLLALVQVLLGALVAGIDAGQAFPTWPLMGESFFPADAFYLPEGGAVWRAFFENPGLAQFMHRMAGYLLFVLGLVVWVLGRRSAQPATVRALNLAVGALIAQAALGVATVLHAAALPLAFAHLAGAILVWVLILRLRHRSLYPIVQTIRGGK